MGYTPTTPQIDLSGGFVPKQDQGIDLSAGMVPKSSEPQTTPVSSTPESRSALANSDKPLRMIHSSGMKMDVPRDRVNEYSQHDWTASGESSDVPLDQNRELIRRRNEIAQRNLDAQLNDEPLAPGIPSPTTPAEPDMWPQSHGSKQPMTPQARALARRAIDVQDRVITPAMNIGEVAREYAGSVPGKLEQIQRQNAAAAKEIARFPRNTVPQKEQAEAEKIKALRDRAIANLPPDQQAKIRESTAQTSKAAAWSQNRNTPEQRAEDLEGPVSRVPDAWMPALDWSNRNYVEPKNKFTGKVGKAVGEAAEQYIAPRSEETQEFWRKVGDGTVTPQEIEEQRNRTFAEVRVARAHHPAVMGVTRGSAEFVGSMASDPTLWPLMGAGSAAPGASRAMGAFFGAHMAHSAVQQSDQLAKVWFDPNVSQDKKYAMATSIVLSIVMAAKAGGHAAHPNIKALTDEHLGFIPEQDRPAIQAAVEQKLQSATQEQAPTQPIDISAGLVKSSAPAKPQRYKLPDNQAVATVDKPVAGPNVRSVEVDGQHYAFDPRKTNAQQVKASVASGELWKLTGEKPPAEVQERAVADVRGEQPEKPADNISQPVDKISENSQSDIAAGLVRRDPVTDLSNVRLPEGEYNPQARGNTAHVASVRTSELNRQLRDAQRAGDTQAQGELQLALDREKAVAENKPFDIHEQIEAHPDPEVKAYLKGIYGDNIEAMPADKGAGYKPSATLQPVKAEDERGTYRTFGNAIDVNGNWGRLKDLPDDADVVMYHATTEANAQKILQHGFNRGEKPTNFGGDRDYTYLGGYGEGHGLGSYIGGATYGGKPTIVVAKVKKGLLEPDRGSDWKSHFRSNPSDRAFAKSNGINIADPTAVDTYAIINQVRARNEHVDPIGTIDVETKEFTPKSDTTSRPQSGGPTKGIYGERPASAELGQAQPPAENRSGQADRESIRARPASQEPSPPEASPRAPEESAVGPQPGKAGEMPVSDLNFDPKRFQYKMNTDSGGTTNLLKGQNFNENLSGVIQVWRDPADGKMYVVNGHHRAQLARETGQQSLLVRHLDVPDAASARAVGAMTNIAEGRGTAIDAAKFMREKGITPADLEKHGVSLGEATAENGLALSKLDPYIFDKVVSGDLPQGRAIAIGKATDNPTTQEAIVKLIDKAERRGRKVTDGMVAELARFAKQSSETTTETQSLFGTSIRTENTALDKADVSDFIKNKLAQEKRVFSSVATEGKAETLGQVKGQTVKASENRKIADAAAQAQEVYDKLSASKGSIDDILEQSARRIAKGDDPLTVKADAYKAARVELGKTVSAAEGRSAEGSQDRPGRPEEVKEPALPGMEPHIEAQKESAATTQAGQLSKKLTEPYKSVSSKTGEMERSSPLFRDSEASGQGGLFGEAPIKGRATERGSSTPSALPITALVESVSGAAEKASNWYHGQVDKLLEWAKMGNTRPEIRQFDPNAADLATKMDAGGQYHKAVAKMIGEKVTGPLTEKFEKTDSPAQVKAKNDTSRDRMKGFHFMADEQNRAWLQENHPEDFERWSNDPQIQKALKAYKPYEGDLRNAVKQLGGKTLDEDYIKRVMDFTTSGIDQKTAPGEGSGGGRDNIVSPQTAKSKSRTDAGQFYWDHGVFDFGPSFEKRWVEVMSKLDEHRLAVHSMSMGTRIMPDEAAPDKIFYNGQEFYRPDVAKEIRDVQRRGVSSDSKALADALGVSELPVPGKVRQYGFYEPLSKGSRFENAARGLANSVVDSEGRATGTKLTEADRDSQIAQARSLLNMQKMKYAMPKEIVSALEDAGREKELGALAQKVSKVLGPVTQFVRQQVVGLAYGIPHMANIMRKVVQVHPGAALNPVGWTDAFKVAFSRELQSRGIRGPADPAYDMLLKNAAISEAAIPDYKHYIEGNFNPKNWEGIKEATTTTGNAFRTGGRAGAKVTPLSAAVGPIRLAIEPLNRFSEAGHNNLFKQGGIDQRARIWMHDFIKDRVPEMKEEEVAYRINQTLGRYNRASWTDIQRNLGPFMMFPGWDYSSVTYALRHPFKTAVAPALLVLMANTAINMSGGNKKEDSKDLSHVHVGKYQVRTNLLNDNMGSHMFGWALRGTAAAMQGKNAKGVTGEMVRGIPGDVAGASTGMLNPVISAATSLGFDRARPGSSQEISPRGDSNKKGLILPNKVAEDYTMFGARHLFPLLDRVSPQGQRPAWTSLGGLAGVSVTKNNKKRR